MRTIKTLSALTLSASLLASGAALAAPEEYKLDPTHSFIEFSIPHLGISVLKGRFNELGGSFVYDEENPAASSVNVQVRTASVDSNHAERDKHIRSEDFLEVGKFPVARFESSSFEPTEGGGVLKGELSLHGQTHPITVDVAHVGAGEDPWGGYRRGFTGVVEIDRGQWGIDTMKPEGETVKLEIFLEGIRQ
ncbi:YceI family protein [Alkalilimnicola sp. S0819]|uniref:YceI family protein n=1 Tax=Alkalilimnicola sp. S0819 TaxID=2613922 RepID=UPI0012616B62|nr:YceI family protein [Alkalilimnicola sp. S0819]KAB7627781.1 hypothetical protein F3N43_02045 [Alkalilimnicola sp. S0819]MPQ15409.1 hypothetical protein [Alkalilimnicola sp. S0819]